MTQHRPDGRCLLHHRENTPIYGTICTEWASLFQGRLLLNTLPGVDACRGTRDTKVVILNFRHKGLEILLKTGTARGVQPAHVPKLTRVLAALDAASSVTELNLPRFKTHPLKGTFNGYGSIWVNGNWRVTFRFIGTDVEPVDYQDYH